MTKAAISPCFAPEQRQHVSPRSDNTQTVDLGGSDQDDSIISRIAYFRSWLSTRLSVATKRTRSGHDQSPYLLAPDA